MPQIEIETSYQPWTPAGPAEEALAAAVTGPEPVIVNHSALACVEQLLSLLHPAGSLLVNDYGPVQGEDPSGHISLQRFGGSVALGINFPLLEQVLVGRRYMVVAPEGDEKRRVHTRLISRSIGDNACALLRKRFSLDNDQYRDAPQEEARRNVAAGRASEAVAAYRALIERNPSDWQMLGEAAEYVGLQLRDHDTGLRLARSALQTNPWCSAWLWNILGDCLFYQGKVEQAHEAFVEAQRIDPDDPRTNLNLAYTHSALGAQTEALIAIARGLAQDGRGRAAYRQRLLEKQAQVLGLLSERASAEQERLIRRAERFR